MRGRVVGGLAAVLVVLGLTACSELGPDKPPSTPPAGTCLTPYDAGVSEHALSVGGDERSYAVAAPDDRVVTRKLPVVYLFHGLGSNASDTLDYTAMTTLADQRGFLVVAPEAEGKDKEWDVAGIAKGQGKDSAFLDRLVRQVKAKDCVDPRRQFAAGLSNGSGVSIALACRGSDGLAGYAGVATTFYDAGCDDSPPASIIYFHGTGDKVVPFDGGATPAFSVRAVPAVLADWAKHDGCDATPTVQQVGEDVRRSTWKGCKDDVRLRSYTIAGGGHTWPGAAAPIPSLGRTTDTIDASTLILDFFGITKK